MLGVPLGVGDVIAVVSRTWSIPPASSIAWARVPFQCGASTRNESRA